MHYIQGHHNIVADCLSRPVCATSADSFDLQALAQSQIEDAEVTAKSQHLSPYEVAPNLQLWCDTSTSSPRPFVPLISRQPVISSLHNLSHPGVSKTTQLVKQRYFWPSLDKDVKEFVLNCMNCQKSKVQRHTHSPVSPISAPSDRFTTVHIDIVGPLPSATLPTVTYQAIPYLFAIS